MPKCVLVFASICLFDYITSQANNTFVIFCCYPNILSQRVVTSLQVLNGHMASAFSIEKKRSKSFVEDC